MREKIEFLEGEFVDFKGNVREYTMAAISCPISEDDEYAGDDEVKQLRLGLAVRREGDKYVRGIGMVEAERKARENPFGILRVNMPGLINTEVVLSVLEQEASFFEGNPGKYIAAYNQEAEDYRIACKVNEIYEGLSKEAKAAHEYMLTSTEEEFQDLATCVIYSSLQNKKGFA